METTRQTSTTQSRVLPTPKEAGAFDEAKFFPGGIIAFFVLLITLGLVIWFGIYLLMINRL